MIIQITRNHKALTGGQSYFYLEWHQDELKFWIGRHKIIWVRFLR